jgi:hypothetical protein
LDRFDSTFARSLASLDYDCDRHPSFEAYARGFMNVERHRDIFAVLVGRFPLQPSAGFAPGSSDWEPPKRRRG